MSSQQLSRILVSDDKSEETVGIIHDDDDIDNGNDERCVENLDHPDVEASEEEEMDTPHLRRIRTRITYLANAEFFFAVVSIAVSAFALACASCGTLGASVGSGVWCPVFFLVFAGMCRGNSLTIHPSKIICVFGGAAAYFAVLMFAIETLEVTQAFREDPFHASAASLHISLCCTAAIEFSLIVSTICLHMGAAKSIRSAYNSVKTPANDYVLPSVMKGKKPQMI